MLALDADRVAARYYDRDAKQSMLLEFDLNAPGAGTPVPVTPALGRVVARTTDFLLTRPDSLNSPYDVNVLRAEDWSTDFGGFVGTNNYLQGASVESVGTYQRFAIAYSPDSGECESIFHIDVIWPAPGQIVPTVLSAFAPTGYTLGQQSGNEVNDLWWDDQGDLFASVRSWTCTAGTSELERKRVAAPSQIWQLTSSNTWTKQSSETATTARPLQDGSRILLRIPECVGPTDTGDTPPQIYCNVGDLYREKSGARELIAEEVIWISTPSPISTAPPTGSATAVAPTSASVEPAASAYPGE